ncbi:MAG: hypothetical protein R3D61_11030 [Defluviimonas denitrificans]
MAERGDGAPQVSFAREEAEELGLKLGDRITVNVLGRDAKRPMITSFREVDFSTAGIGFVMVMNPPRCPARRTVSSPPSMPTAGQEAPVLRELASAYPNITAIRIRDVVDRVSEALGRTGHLGRRRVTLLTGLVALDRGGGRGL